MVYFGRLSLVCCLLLGILAKLKAALFGTALLLGRGLITLLCPNHINRFWNKLISLD